MSVDDYFDGLCPTCGVRLRAPIVQSYNTMPMSNYDRIPGRVHFCVPTEYRINQQLAEIKRQAKAGRK